MKTKAWKILEQAETEAILKSMAEDRAACGEWPEPKTPEDYLAWIKDEIQVQKDLSGSFMGLPDKEEVKLRLDYVEVMQKYVDQLEVLGLKTDSLPWEK